MKQPPSVLVRSAHEMDDPTFIRHYNARHPELSRTLGDLPDDLSPDEVDRYRALHIAAHRDYPGTGHHHNKRDWRKP